MNAIFKSFDNFMAMFVAMFAVAWSTVFMPLLGGPLHTYEARAIGAGWQSLQTGQAANIQEALEVATNLPVEAVFPSAHAEVVPLQLVSTEPEPLELLGGPDADVPSASVVRRAAAQTARARASHSRDAIIAIEASSAPVCDIPEWKEGPCETEVGSGAVAAST